MNSNLFMTALFVFNCAHHMALNKITQDILDIQRNISSQKKSLTTIFEQHHLLDGIVTDTFTNVRFVKEQTDAMHLRMSAYENTI